jgi:hypothetical protein
MWRRFPTYGNCFAFPYEARNSLIFFFLSCPFVPFVGDLLISSRKNTEDFPRTDKEKNFPQNSRKLRKKREDVNEIFHLRKLFAFPSEPQNSLAFFLPFRVLSCFSWKHLLFLRGKKHGGFPTKPTERRISHEKHENYENLGKERRIMFENYRGLKNRGNP